MQTVVDRALLLQQVSDFAVQQLLAELQERLEHLENTLAAMVAAGNGQVEDALAEVLKNGRLAAVLARAGYATVEAVAAAPDDALLAIDGVGEKALKAIREKVG